MVKGRIFDIQRFSLHDGPGIRTTVFFQGCPLRCLWCGNPESISPKPLLSYQAEKCIGCGACIDACPEKALSLGDGGKAALDRGRCTVCGKCAAECGVKALEIVGREAGVKEVLDVVLRDRDYYEKSGGGLTLSGGEPLMQPDFAFELLACAKSAGLHGCIETSGMAEWRDMERLHSAADLWLYDFKETDPKLHAQFAGFWNSTILANLSRLHDAGARILLRCPMVPQHNARQEHLDGIVALARRLPKLEGIELLPYYNLWRSKLVRFGLKTQLPESVRPPDGKTVETWRQYLRDRGVKVVG